MLTKARILVSLVLVGVLSVLPGIHWNTFLGAANTSYNDGYDEGWGVAVDGSGNTYVTGFSQYSWGTPLRAHDTGQYDVFVAKLNSSGSKVWNTFLGGAAWDFAGQIAVDGNGNTYVIGVSQGTWGSPIRSFAGGDDAFVAKLSSSGTLQWSTFLGGEGYDSGDDIALDGAGNVYVIGSGGNWGSPVRPYSAMYDTFVAKLNSSGALQWNTFIGGAGSEKGFSLTIGPQGEILLTGESDANWGAPLVAYQGGDDAFVAKLDQNGALQWNTFLGGQYDERGEGIAVDGSGNVYLAGFTWWGWGIPLSPYEGGLTDAFVAKLNANGAYQWHTFLGSKEDDSGDDLSIDSHGNIYVTGYSADSWGNPYNDFSGSDDAFVAKLNGSGVRLWNTFVGGYGAEDGYAIVVDDANFYLTGSSSASWGTPLIPFAGGTDAFVTRGDANLPIFADVPASYWARSYIERLFNAGVTGGCSASPLSYCPETTVNRAQMAVFLLRGIHGSSYSPPAVGIGTGFSDVPTDYWASAWIKQLAAEGITGGCGNGKFCPEYPVTRDQMAVFLLRSEHGSAYSPPAVVGGTGFTDVPPEHWAAAWIKQLVTEGITAGCGGGNYCPNTVVTRAQMAVFLVRTFNLP